MDSPINAGRHTGLPLLFICFCLLANVSAQTDIPLFGPVVAVTTAQQDRILLYDVTNNTQRELSFGPLWHQMGDFSPDGCRITFTLSDGIAPARLYSARLDGDDLRELVTYSELAPDDWGVWAPQWSPDGTRIAFTMIRDNRPNSTGREYHIAWVDANGGTPEFYSVTGDEHEPRWSPDGQWLAYISYENRVPGADIYSTAEPNILAAATTTPYQPENLLHEADLWVVSIDGETKYRLTSYEVGSVRNPRWSPDGDLISFVYSPAPNNDQFWMIANQQGALMTQLSATWSLILDNTWLPDSTAIIGAVRDFQEVPENRLWLIPLIGLADTGATQYPIDSALSYVDYPRFSADGRWLALRTAYALAIVDTENFTHTLYESGPPGNTPPVWSPAGFTDEALCP